jgi:hypothetical protein
MQNIDDVNYPASDTSTYTFDNKATAWFAQLSYRPSQIGNKVIRRFELAGRYCSLDNPKGSMWSTDKTQFGITLDYWIKWNAVVKIGYEQDVNHPDVGDDVKTATRYLFQLAMGF